ncbi:hypothetical protein CAEBREN_19032 [Caenorhabditis brenneri]|uniref:Uncharacterized protein n=1 Tax=Caenorhabditis brenneri TaxID=135651 RepID=G0NI84_CAEBE|nr:hypothetical protein CAEBREN_19032 [Caenorhabditis brenneri]
MVGPPMANTSRSMRQRIFGLMESGEEEEVALENDWGDLDRDPRVAQQFREDWNAALILHGRNLQKREDEEGTSIDMRDRGSLGSWSVANNSCLEFHFGESHPDTISWSLTEWYPFQSVGSPEFRNLSGSNLSGFSQLDSDWWTVLAWTELVMDCDVFWFFLVKNSAFPPTASNAWKMTLIFSLPAPIFPENSSFSLSLSLRSIPLAAPQTDKKRGDASTLTPMSHFLHSYAIVDY